MTLAAHALDYGYPGRSIGRGLDLTLEAGEVLCVLGPNGAGKSTLFRTLLGLLPAQGGEVTLEGRPITALARRDIARAVSYVPQAAGGYFDFSLLEVVEMGRTAHLGAFERPRPIDRRIALESLERLGIAQLAERPVSQVSGGERQLALIARALASEARALVMDEPTANLDFGNQSRVLFEIARLKASGIAVLLCTHDPDHAFLVADRALLLGEGHSIAMGPIAQVLSNANLSRLYGIDVHVAQVDGPAGSRRVCVPSLAR